MPQRRLLVDPALRDELEFDGLLDINTLVAHKGLETVKARLESRQTYRLKTSRGTTLYLKLYRRVEPEPRFARLLAQRFDSPASREWHVLERLLEINVPTMRAAACIEEFENDKVTRAALLTVGLDAPISLSRLIAEQFAESPQVERRQSITIRLARVLRMMHESGVNHRDFYLVHIRVGPEDNLYVTDLNRADIRKRVTRRWRVKDVAALLHSAPTSIVTATDKARFMRTYLGNHLRAHRSFIEAVIRKADRMTARTNKRVAEGEANYHVVE